jgi:hypothetical protein
MIQIPLGLPTNIEQSRWLKWILPTLKPNKAEIEDNLISAALDTHTLEIESLSISKHNRKWWEELERIGEKREVFVAITCSLVMKKFNDYN